MTSSAGRVAGSGGCSSCISRTGSSSRGIFISSVWGISVAATERAACTLRGGLPRRLPLSFVAAGVGVVVVCAAGCSRISTEA